MMHKIDNNKGNAPFAKAFAMQSAFIAYLTVGHRSLTYTLDACFALEKGGVDIIELGMPFSDPVADGPVIQQAMQQALTQSICLDDVFTLAKQFKSQSNTPLILFSYYNPIYQYGEQLFYKACCESGIDGVLIVDLPIELAQNHYADCVQSQLAPIFVVSPSTSDTRFSAIASFAQGFIYYACRKGTTGMQAALPEDFIQQMTRFKAQTTCSIVAGFGIADKTQAQQVLEYADGFVVGSYFVNAISQGIAASALTAMAQQLKVREIV